MFDTILGITAVLSAAVAITVGDASTPTIPFSIPVVEYGALGLCAFMIYFLCKHITETHRGHAKERQELIKQTQSISNKVIECYSELTSELKGRMCLIQKHHLVERLEHLVDEADKEKKT